MTSQITRTGERLVEVSFNLDRSIALLRLNAEEDTTKHTVALEILRKMSTDLKSEASAYISPEIVDAMYRELVMEVSNGRP